MTAPAAARGILPLLIGLFAVWQLAFVPLANVMEFVPLRPTVYDINPPIETTQSWGTFTSNETIQSSADGFGNALSFWGEATGQEHGWNMFAPGFPPRTVVPVVDLHFADGSTRRIYSRFDPTVQSKPSFRTPMRYDREFNYEANIFMLLWDHTPQEYANQPELAGLLPQKARENSDLILHYLHTQFWRGKDRQRWLSNWKHLVLN